MTTRQKFVITMLGYALFGAGIYSLKLAYPCAWMCVLLGLDIVGRIALYSVLDSMVIFCCPVQPEYADEAKDEG